jgi:hypothetical protein
VIAMQPILELTRSDAFNLWPVAASDPLTWLSLNGGLSSPEVGTAVRCIADYNDVDPDDAARPGDPLDAFLHGLLTVDMSLAPGGLSVIDDISGVIFVPGCCDGLEDWRDWRRLFSAGGYIGYGHPPMSPVAERVGERIVLTVDAEQDDSPTIELSDADLKRLLAGVERDLTDFLALVVEWAPRHVPGREAAVTAAVAQALDLPG